MINKLIKIAFPSSDERVKTYVNLLSKCKKKKLKKIGIIISRRLQTKYGVFLSYKTSFDETLKLVHPVGIIIGEGVKIGKNVTIFQNTTIGRSDTKIAEYPIIGDNTTIYAGAVLIGKITIGRNCIIGANSVVTRDIPDNSIAIGVPARVIPKNKNHE